MVDADTSLMDSVDDHLARLSQVCVLPDAVQDNAKRILEDGIDAGLINHPVTLSETTAASLLAKRNTEYFTIKEAQQIADALNIGGSKLILATINELCRSDIDTPEKKHSAEKLTEALAIAADQLPVQIGSNEEVTNWCEQHGLGKNGSTDEVIARQTALTVFTRTIVFDTTAVIDTTSLTKASYTESIRQSHQEIGDLSPAWFALDSLVSGLPEPVFDWIVELRDHIEVPDNPSKFLGDCYEILIEQEERWRLGQFQTPPKLASLIADLGIQDGAENVFAPGIGAGSLATAAVQKKHDRQRLEPLGDIHGVDVSPLSLLLGSAALLELRAEGTPTFYERNFFDLSPDEVPEVDTVLTNPPYTKHHELTPTEKAELNEKIAQSTGYSFSKLSPLYVYFTVHATQFLDDGERAVFLTPAEILNTEYGSDWKQFLRDHYSIDAFILFDQESGTQFTGVATTSLITVVTRRENPDEDTETTFLRVNEETANQQITSTINSSIDEDADLEWGYVNPVSRSSLDPEKNWSVFFDGEAPVIDEQLVPLSSLARVTRGIATGQNSFFCLSEGERIGEGNGESWEIDTEFLAPVIRKSHKIPNYDYREEDWEAQREAETETWLLYHLDELDWDETLFAQDIADNATSQQQLSAFSPTESTPESNSTHCSLSDTEKEIVSYLKYGMQLDDPPHQTHLGEKRDTWYVVEQRPPADIVYTSMTRGRGRFVYNKMEARNLNNIHSIYVTEELSNVELKALLAYLNSEFADQIVKRSGRTLSSGMSKVEPGDLKNIPVIDPRDLDNNRVAELAELFDELCSASRLEDEAQEIAIREKLKGSLAAFLDM